MKKNLMIISLFIAFSLNAQSHLNLDEGFVGIKSNTAISGLDLNGSEKYKIPLDTWLEVLSKSEDDDVLTYNDISNKSSKYERIKNNRKTRIDTLNLIVKRLLINEMGFQQKLVEFDKLGNLIDIQFTLDFPNQSQEKIISSFAMLVNTFDELYGKRKHNYDSEGTIGYGWEENETSLSYFVNFKKEQIFLIYLKKGVNESSNVLDSKYGFKEIKLDTEISKFTNISKSSQNSNNSIYKYEPSNEDLKKVFDKDFSNLDLFFNNKTKLLSGIRLTQINIGVNENCFFNSINEIEKLKSKFEEVLGKPNIKINDKTGFGYIWKGEKVKLTILCSAGNVKILKDDSMKSECQIEVFIEKNKKENLSEGF